MNKADQFVTLALIRQIELQQVSTSILRSFVSELEELRRDLALLVLKYDPTEPPGQFARQKRLRALMAEASELIEDAMKELRRRLEEDFGTLLQIAEEDERSNFLAVYGLTLAGAVAASGGTLLIGGSTIGEHMDKIGDDLEFRLRATLRDSVAAGKEAEAIFNEIKGTAEIQSPVDTTARTIEATVRTGVDSVPAEVADELEPRASVISPHGWQHISVLDSRTTTICRARAWKKWDAAREPVGHKMPFSPPPLHPNCRSRIVLIFLDDPEPTRQTLAQWIDQFTPAQQDRLFGSKNLALWRKGLLTDTQLIRQHNRPLSIPELRRRTDAKSKGTFPFL